MKFQIKRVVKIDCFLNATEINTIHDLAKIINDLENLFDENNTDFLAFIYEYYDDSISKLLGELADNPKNLIDNCCEWLSWD